LPRRAVESGVGARSVVTSGRPSVSPPTALVGLNIA
jgi:hypothetical protein